MPLAPQHWVSKNGILHASDHKWLMSDLFQITLLQCKLFLVEKCLWNTEKYLFQFHRYSGKRSHFPCPRLVGAGRSFRASGVITRVCVLQQYWKDLFVYLLTTAFKPLLSVIFSVGPCFTRSVLSSFSLSPVSAGVQVFHGVLRFLQVSRHNFLREECHLTKLILEFSGWTDENQRISS